MVDGHGFDERDVFDPLDSVLANLDKLSGAAETASSSLDSEIAEFTKDNHFGIELVDGSRTLGFHMTSTDLVRRDAITDGLSKNLAFWKALLSKEDYVALLQIIEDNCKAEDGHIHERSFHFLGTAVSVPESTDQSHEPEPFGQSGNLYYKVDTDVWTPNIDRPPIVGYDVFIAITATPEQKQAWLDYVRDEKNGYPPKLPLTPEQEAAFDELLNEKASEAEKV